MPGLNFPPAVAALQGSCGFLPDLLKLLLFFNVGLNLLTVETPASAHLEGGKALRSTGFLPLSGPRGDRADGEPEQLRYFFSCEIWPVGLDHSLSPFEIFDSIGELDEHLDGASQTHTSSPNQKPPPNCVTASDLEKLFVWLTLPKASSPASRTQFPDGLFFSGGLY